MLCFKSAKTIYLFDEVYTNPWELRSFIQQVVIDKVPYVPYTIHNVRLSDISSESFVLFRGNQFSCWRGILMWLSCIGFIVLLSLCYQSEVLQGICIILFPIVAIVFFSSSSKMNFFGVGKKYLIVKKHNLRWWDKVFLIEDIKEIIFEERSTFNDAVTIITKDFKAWPFVAASLPFKDWLKLKDELERTGIKVQNTCINEYYRE